MKMQGRLLLVLSVLLICDTAHAAVAGTPEEFVQCISLDGNDCTINCQRVDFYSPNCKFLLHTGDAAWSAKGYRPFDDGPCRTYLGQVKEAPSAVAVGYLRPDGTVL